MVRSRVLLGAVAAVLAITLAGCDETGVYSGTGYVAPFYAGGYYGWRGPTMAAAITAAAIMAAAVVIMADTATGAASTGARAITIVAFMAAVITAATMAAGFHGGGYRGGAVSMAAAITLMAGASMAASGVRPIERTERREHRPRLVETEICPLLASRSTGGGAQRPSNSAVDR